MGKRLLGLGIGLWLLTGAATAQVIDAVRVTASDANCLASNCVAIDMRGVPSVGIDVSGAGTYTLVVEGLRGEADNATWRVVPVISDAEPDALAEDISAPGSFSVGNSGFRRLRIRASALSVGTPVASFTRGVVAPLFAGGGTSGGGGGAGTEYTEGAVDASITGTAVLMEGAGNTLLPVQGTVADGLLVNLGSNNDVTVTGTVTANAGTNLNTSALALETGGNLAAVAASLAQLDNAVAGSELQVDVVTMPTVTVTAADLDVQSGGADLLSLTAFNASFGVPGTADTQVRSVQGVAGMTPVEISDGGSSITIDGAITCANCSGSGASAVDDGPFTIGTDSVAPTGFLFDDVTPDSVNEGDVGVARMSGNRIQYGIIRDGAGNERGANVNASGQLAVTGPVTNAGTFAVQVDGSALTALQNLDTDATTLIGHVDGLETLVGTTNTNTGAATTALQIIDDWDESDRAKVNPIVGQAGVAAGAGSVGATVQRMTLAIDDPAVALLGTIDADTGNLAAIAASLSVLDDTAGETADEYVSVRLTDGSSFLSLASDWTIGTAIPTSGPGTLAVYSDFDGSALPTITNVNTEGEAVPIAASITGVQYTMLVSEDGSLQYGTTTTPLVVGDGSGAFNVICDSGCSGGTQYTHNDALTADSTVGTIMLGRASTSPPSSVAVNDAVLPWLTTNGATVSTLVTGAGVNVFSSAGSPTSNTVLAVQGISGGTALTVSDGSGAMNTIVDSGTITSLTQFNGQAIALNTGSASAGTLRSVTASDSPEVGHLSNLATYLQPGSQALIRSDNTNNDDETEIKSTPGVLLAISARNAHATTAAYVRCTNATAASTTPGSTAVIYEMVIPPATLGFVQGSLGPAGMAFSTALTCYVATGKAVTDATDAAVDDVVVNITYR